VQKVLGILAAGETEMSLRIRRDGRVLCASMHPEEPGDVYINDGLHYFLSVEAKVLVTEYADDHAKRGEWWWRGRQPPDVTIDKFYLGEPRYDRN
jgi:hypothetical protein